jgi:LmbE family N-acetylglucosaminyl deacetylase
MAALGVTDHRWMGEPDGGLADLDPTHPVGRLTALIEEVAPDSTLTFGPDGITFHPDHRTVSGWVTAAWRNAGCPGRLLHAVMSTEHLERWDEQYRRWNVTMTDDRPQSTEPGRLALRVQPTGALLDRKLVALRAMHTQVADALATLGPDDFEAMAAEECFVAVSR